MTQRVDSYLQVGPHQDASDTTSTAGTTRFLRPREKLQLHGAKYQRLGRDYQTGDGSRLSALQGPQDLGTLPGVSFNLLGLSGSGAGDGVNANTLDTDLDELLKLTFGDAAAADTTIGDTTHAADAGTGTTMTLDGSPATGSTQAWLVLGTTTAKRRPRFQVSASAANVTMCRALTTDAGAADTADEAAVVYGGRVYALENNAPNRIPLFMDVEGAAQRDVYRGVWISRAVFDFSPGGLLSASFDFAYSSGDFAGSLQTPTYSAPTQGSEIKVWDSPVWIGSTQVMARGATVTIDNTLSERRSQGGEQGNYGYVVESSMATVDLTIGYGALTLEQARSYVTTIQGEATQDLLISGGSAAGAAAAMRIPALDCDAEIVANGGKHEIKITGTGTGTVPAQLAIF